MIELGETSVAILGIAIDNLTMQEVLDGGGGSDRRRRISSDCNSQC